MRWWNFWKGCRARPRPASPACAERYYHTMDYGRRSSWNHLRDQHMFETRKQPPIKTRGQFKIKAGTNPG